MSHVSSRRPCTIHFKWRSVYGPGEIPRIPAHFQTSISAHGLNSRPTASPEGSRPDLSAIPRGAAFPSPLGGHHVRILLAFVGSLGCYCNF